MNITVLGSGSSGNCYVLKNETEALIIELGVNFNSVLKVIKYKTSIISACVSSHYHLDHSKYIPNALKLGIDVYTSSSTINHLKLKPHHCLKKIETMETIKAGNFKIMAFDTVHNIDGSQGYIISHPEIGKLLFLTDSSAIPYKFSGINHFLVEANFDEDKLMENVELGKIHSSLAERIKNDHLSIKACSDLILANDLTVCKNIILCHLSQNNSQMHSFIKTIKQASGCMVDVALPGKVFDLSLNPY